MIIPSLAFAFADAFPPLFVSFAVVRSFVSLFLFVVEEEEEEEGAVYLDWVNPEKG